MMVRLSHVMQLEWNFGMNKLACGYRVLLVLETGLISKNGVTGSNSDIPLVKTCHLPNLPTITSPAPTLPPNKT
jgi:hypothetical protein